MTLASFWGKILAEEKKRGKSQSRAVVHQQQIKCDLLFGKSNNTHRRTTQKNSHSSRKMREKNCIRTKRLTVTDDNGRFEENRVAEPSSSQPSPSFHCVNPSSGRSEKDEEQKTFPEKREREKEAHARARDRREAAATPLFSMRLHGMLLS